MFKNIVRTKKFWTVFVATSLISAVVGSKYLFKVLPMMSIDVHMNREQALQKTQSLAKNYNWAPHHSSQTAHFEQDVLTQFFAELECGGIKTFQNMIKEKLYEPYQWHVRNFQEGVAQESHVFFTPQGEPYGFNIKLAEQDNPGNLGITEARNLALQSAQKDWNISFDHYKEVEASKEETPQGRIDHTFLYERTNTTLGNDGKYRIQLVVRGNVFAELKQFVLVPEAFTRRYIEMRAQNNIFSNGFGMIFRMLYLILGGLIGGFILIRKRRYLLIPAMAAVGVLSLFSLLNTFNSLPLAWMNYNTAQSSTSFIVTLITIGIFGVIQNFIVFLLVVGAGESLGRWAFPDHVQFWKSWSSETGGSLTVLGQTIGGYGLFCFELPLMAALYYILTHGLGWWAPTGTLIDPNILATYAPWLGAFSNSVSAGFWEEFAFRALPIAGMILLGRYFKKETLFLTVGLLLQALIFGGMHTFYAQQPVYFRIVELFIPSLIWAGTYIVFGLLPGIICHYLWDLMWFAFPIMVSDAPGIFIQKIIILVLALFPLLLVLFRKWQKGGVWEYASETAKNNVWQVPSENKNHSSEQPTTLVTHLSDYKIKIILGAGLLGLIACGIFGIKKTTNPELTLTKQEAILSAQQALQELPDTDKSWTILTHANAGTARQQNDQSKKNYTHMHRFIWQTQPRSIYNDLLGTYLQTAHWNVRFALFEGDVAERAEEYVCFVDTQGKVYRIWHVLPEAQKGKSLSAGEARGIALKTIQEKFGLSTQELKEISALDSKKPDRKDWNFIFQDTSLTLEDGGQARINIIIGGDQVIDYERFIFIPETWVRAETLKESILSSFSTVAILFIILLIMLSIGATAKESIHNFSLSQFLLFFSAIIIITGISTINKIPFISFSFTSAQSFSSQMFSLLSAMFGSIILQGFGLAFLLNGLTIHYKQATYAKNKLLYGIGLVLPFIWYGIAALCNTMLPELAPPIADLAGLSCYSPLINTFIFGSFYLLLSVALITPISLFFTYLTHNWKNNIIVGLTLCLCLGIALTTLLGAESLFACFVIGIPLGIILYIVHRSVLMHDPSLLIPVFASTMALKTLQNGLLQGYPAALSNAVLGVILVTGIGIFWFKKIKNKVF